jgi:hypothetical protein
MIDIRRVLAGLNKRGKLQKFDMPKFDRRWIALGVAAVAVAGFGAWRMMALHPGGSGQPAAPIVVPGATAEPRPAAHPAGAVGAPAPSARRPAPVAGAAAPAAQPPSGSPIPASSGRPDPFAPLVAQAAPSGGPGSVPLPPIPPLAPGAVPGGPGSAIPGAPAAPDTGPMDKLQLTGIVYGPGALAILNDAGSSYIAGPGDTVPSGVRVVAVDVQHRSVTLAWQDHSWQLRLEGGKAR